ncbi:SUMF1/EgtB/PvdO family nonheme iron enzyme [Phaeodactylibacter sp.]|uniref:SUMF1/EgtB/PvdO family nonheme iron enzyme n=1 Tax=Phaeodactylibacter sp. TaxID=1940289 RepID=UPI0025D25427|nr:SUMF1/EgtB/PvdO family nonheme iron enzyme [Phaeodactylibacter sp.]MCI4648396.1 SUMF1/EgtB/PvdO family nonheme iron enzyme [Phaeodactylibacter sp.]MCI5094134.1 SUMF1/EgtB/PvdO family nonheme iron enzyme [Phaeodactylibacter sp.]
MRFIVLFLLVGTLVNSRAQSPRSSQDRALFFAVSNYEEDGLSHLPQPVANVHAIAKELKRRFGFETEVVEDPTLGQIQANLAEHKRDGLLPDRAVKATPLSGNMAFVKGGTFQMGSTSTEGGSDEKPVHSVTVSDFYIGRHEVTFEEYDAYCEATGKSKPDDEGWGRARRPVIYVSWHDAVAYCNWRSQQEGYQPVYTISGDRVTADWSANGYRLPTEAEWEFAARERGKNVQFGNGKDIARASELNFDASESYKTRYSVVGTYRKQTVPVGSLNSPNELNLHDMSGNVWEWCWDWYDSDYYNNSSSRNPRGSSTGSRRVLRGGSWSNGPAGLRCAYRNGGSPDRRYDDIGFRLSRTAE